MTTTTAGSSRRARSRRGYTLVELMMASALATLVLSGACSGMLLLSRACIATADYAGMDQQARFALETFARDIRMASAVSNFTADSVTLTIPSGGTTVDITYAYDPGTKNFYRAFGSPGQKRLISDVETFLLRRYNVLQLETTKDIETKQIQIELRAVRTGPARATASNNVISARYILRNKVVGN